MNAISRPATPDEASDVADLIYVSKAELDRLAADQRAEAQRIRRRAFLTGQWKTVALGVLAFAVVAREAREWFGPPRERVHTTIAYQREDGTTTSFVEWSDLPQNIRNDTTVNALWGYVMQRESWSEGNASWARTVVASMSEPKVREAFLAWYEAENKDSPAYTYRDGTSVEARPVNWVYGDVNKAPEDQDSYVFWWDRYEWKSGAATPIYRGKYSTTVRFRRGLRLSADRMWQRWVFNAPLVQVTGYDTPRREGITTR